jgi:hypothetical protein
VAWDPSRLSTANNKYFRTLTIVGHRDASLKIRISIYLLQRHLDLEEVAGKVPCRTMEIANKQEETAIQECRLPWDDPQFRRTRRVAGKIPPPCVMSRVVAFGAEAGRLAAAAHHRGKGPGRKSPKLRNSSRSLDLLVSKVSTCHKKRNPARWHLHLAHPGTRCQVARNPENR